MDKKTEKLLKTAVNEMYLTGKVRKELVDKLFTTGNFSIPQLERLMTARLNRKWHKQFYQGF